MRFSNVLCHMVLANSWRVRDTRRGARFPERFAGGSQKVRERRAGGERGACARIVAGEGRGGGALRGPLGVGGSAGRGYPAYP